MPKRLKMLQNVKIARKRPKASETAKTSKFVQAIPPGGSAARGGGRRRSLGCGAAAAAAAATAAVAAAAAGGRQSHRAGWLEQNFDVLAVLSVFERFRAVLTFWSIFSRFGVFFSVFGRFWSVSDLGFGLGNNPRRQVFEETGIWRLH